MLNILYILVPLSLTSDTPTYFHYTPKQAAKQALLAAAWLKQMTGGEEFVWP